MPREIWISGDAVWYRRGVARGLAEGVELETPPEGRTDSFVEDYYFVIGIPVVKPPHYFTFPFFRQRGSKIRATRE